MRVKIEFEVEVPDDIPFVESDLDQYLGFHFEEHGSLTKKNPFYNEGKPAQIDGTFSYEFVD